MLALTLAAAVRAQQIAPASVIIRSSQEPDSPAAYFTQSGKIILENRTLKDCVRIAWEMEVARPAGKLKWTDQEKFDIEIDANRGADEDQMKALLRDELEKRFGLAVHRESKVFPAYTLVVAKSGAKIHPGDPAAGHMNMRRGQIVSESASLINFAQALSVALNTPVIDKTGLAGVYSFSLEWRPEVVQPGALTTDDDEPNVLPNPPAGPNLFSAIEQQLGLKLEPLKTPVEMIVIERAERP